MAVRRMLAVAMALCLSALIAGSAMAQKEAKRQAQRGAKKGAKERAERKTPERAASSLGAFQAVDANGDGKVSKAELTAMIDKRFAAADKDGDGALDAREIRSLGFTPQPSPAERAAATFAKMDMSLYGSKTHLPATVALFGAPVV